MSQFCTLEQAQAVVAKINAIGIGGGVMPYNPATVNEINPPYQDNDPKRSGIYIPIYTQGPFPTPGTGELKFYFLRFVDGAEGFNAGLILQEIALFPTSWPTMLSLEVNAAAAWVAQQNN